MSRNKVATTPVKFGASYKIEIYDLCGRALRMIIENDEPWLDI